MNESEKADNQIIDATYRDYVWNYFSLHADQRMKSFNFYILLVTAIIGGLAVTLKDGHFNKSYSLFGVLLFMFSFLFWKLDERTRHLIKNSEDALIYLDEKFPLQDQNLLPHPLRIFSRDLQATANAARLPLMSGHFSYARVFRWIFSIFGLIGVAVTFFFLLATPS